MDSVIVDRVDMRSSIIGKGFWFHFSLILSGKVRITFTFHQQWVRSWAKKAL